jgi:hypothetical protein
MFERKKAEAPSCRVFLHLGECLKHRIAVNVLKDSAFLPLARSLLGRVLGFQVPLESAMRFSKVAVFTLSAMVAASANAALITFDDKGFVNFDDVTTQYAADGVIFSGLENDAAVNLEAVDGTVFSDSTPASPPMSLSNFFNDNSGLRADVMSFNFLAPASGIEFDYNPAGSRGVNSTVNLYNSFDSLISSYTIGSLYTVMTTPNHWRVVVPDGGVSRLDLLQPDDDWGHYVDNLSFTPVPEPGTLLLLCAGLLGLRLRCKG